MLASLIVHRYLAAGRASTFLRWQAIGLVALCGWGLTLFIGTGLECLLRANPKPIDEVFSLLFALLRNRGDIRLKRTFGSAIQAASISALQTQAKPNLNLGERNDEIRPSAPADQLDHSSFA